MAITKLNSQAIPPNTIVESDLSYPLTSFSSTGIDDNATETAITIDQYEKVKIGTASGSPLAPFHVHGGSETLTVAFENDNGLPLSVQADTGYVLLQNTSDTSTNPSGQIKWTTGNKLELYGGIYKSITLQGGAQAGGYGAVTVHEEMNTDDINVTGNVVVSGDVVASAFTQSLSATTALSITSAGRVTTGENLVVTGDESVGGDLTVTGNISAGQITATDTVTTGSPQNGAADFLSLINNDTGPSHHIGIKFASTDAGGTARHGAYVSGLKDGTWGDGTGSYPMHLTFWTRPASSGVQIERLRIDSNGNVGIGQSTPFAGAVGSDYTTVHIGDGASAPTQSRLLLEGSASTYGIFTNSARFGIYDYTADAERLTVRSTGTVAFHNGIEEKQYSLTGTVIEPDNGTIQYKTLSANTTFTESLSNGEFVTLMINDGSNYTVTWPTTTWIGGSAPVLQTTGYNVIELWHVNGTLYGAFVGTA